MTDCQMAQHWVVKTQLEGLLDRQAANELQTNNFSVLQTISALHLGYKII